MSVRIAFRPFACASLWVAACAMSPAAHAAEVFGAGASFPSPVYLQWAAAYQKATGNAVIYQSIGSGGGVKETIGKSIDFGATDVPLSPERLQKDGLVQFPAIIGGVVPVVNLPGVAPGEVRLTGPLLADIYLGKITRWDDKQIERINPGVSLPNMSIAVIRRSDGAGASFLFTNYLSKVSQEWKQRIGAGTIVSWPVGLGGKGDVGVTNFVQRLPGAIGFVEYAYARQNKLTFVKLQNRAGEFVAPDEASLAAAAASANWEKTAYGEVITDQAAKEAWPLAGATFIVMRKVYDKPAQAVEALKFFEWAYKNGDKLAADASFVALPDITVNQLNDAWRQIKDASGKEIALM